MPETGEHYSRVEIDQVNMGQDSQAPRVRAYVDGVKVVWRSRDPERNRTFGYTGWICQEHAQARCWHEDDVEDCLSEELLARMRSRER
jgi:hypothetical protein